MAAYTALFGYEAALSTLENPAKLKVPTLILMDPGDELVSQRRLQYWIDRHGLRPEWRVRPLFKDPLTAASRIKHHVITSRALGKPAFDALVSTVSAALIDGVMPSS